MYKILYLVPLAASLVACGGPPHGKNKPPQHQPGPQGGKPQGPPPAEAVAACEARSASDACSFEHGGHSVAGKCQPGPDGGALACRGDGPPPPGGP